MDGCFSVLYDSFLCFQCLFSHFFLSVLFLVFLSFSSRVVSVCWATTLFHCRFPVYDPRKTYPHRAQDLYY